MIRNWEYRNLYMDFSSMFHVCRIFLKGDKKMIPEWNSFINADCMEYLKEFPDDYFDLALVDPPYGDGGGTSTANGERFGGRFDRYKGGYSRHYAFGARKRYKTEGSDKE